ncbi:hypothetical protein QJS10_CPB22g00037 [Acorus calamus]|uniref:Glycoside hydrolase family 5 domain-containing protein n=1 Tax=Acorus calamus TaxID=4465 RepID=A0AAV9BYH5_ACOCL|nr:hypothetical protein QJS10_CPB22g00037 [Acorus calamus]
MSTHTSSVSVVTILALALLLSLHQCSSLPLSTNGRFIVDAASGQRVKLRCVNWPAHIQAVLPEGLSERPVGEIASLVASLGFNCVRLTYATFTWTEDDKYANLTVEGSLQSLGLMDAVEGVRRNNPSLIGLTVRDAYEKVVDALGDAGVMVVLDNHVSFPMWCCDNNDGNGFFGDKYFDPQVWVNGLHNVAQRFNGKSQVVGMSMRNELRGPNQNVTAWYNYIPQAAATIHTTNPNVLVIISGLSFDTDLSFLESRPLPFNLDHKLVHEAHWYSFGRHNQWETQNPGHVCADDTNAFDQKAGFLIRPAVGRESVPLFVSEFGVDQRGVNMADNRYFTSSNFIC